MQQAADGIDQRVDGHAAEQNAVERQYHGFQVPEAELETVVAFLGNQLGSDQHQDFDERCDQREKTIKQDGLRT